MNNYQYIRIFGQIGLDDLPNVGGKNASLGELFQNLVPKGVRVPDGFVLTAQAYWHFLDEANIRQKLAQQLEELDTENFANLHDVGSACRFIIESATLPKQLQYELINAFTDLKKKYKSAIQVAVRSSATAEDLPTASFAGQQESFLNITSNKDLLGACKACFASLFTDRAIKYRVDNGFEHMQVALSIGVQKMVRSDKAGAGVCFTIDTETGFKEVIAISAAWGLGENVVKGNVTPDEYIVYKPALKENKKAIIGKHIGPKEKTMVYGPSKRDRGTGHKINTINKDTISSKRSAYVLDNSEIETLARWALLIEEYYKMPMDIEWAKDGYDNQLYIVQARPETVHSQRDSYKFFDYKLKGKGKILAVGKNVGSKVASGKARILYKTSDINQLQEGEILVTEITNPDWDPILKKAAAIITDRGGRTSHAAIVARETGAVAVVGTGNATAVISNGQYVTVSCADGQRGIVYDGNLEYTCNEIDIRKISQPITEVKFILADPDQAFRLSALPNSGVGLMRLEFVINNTIKIHPMALANFSQLHNHKERRQIEKMTLGYADKGDFFVEKLSQAVGTIAAAFYPKEVIVRMSDFKTNEYAHLLGGNQFEPLEENPMLGWRGASRYYSTGYKAGFELECRAMKVVRDEMGLTNVKLMIPFCRTIDEGKQVLQTMAEFGLNRGVDGLEIYVMVEIPSNVLLADDFAQLFDGFSIGSNDLTQLTLGIDRDSELLASQFDAANPAVKKLIEMTITAAHNHNIKVGLCGQAPSDSPPFAAFLVQCGIDSISFNPDALLKGIGVINHVEQGLKIEPASIVA